MIFKRKKKEDFLAKALELLAKQHEVITLHEEISKLQENVISLQATRNSDLEEALRVAKSNLLWATGGWGKMSEADISRASQTLYEKLAQIDEVLEGKS